MPPEDDQVKFHNILHSVHVQEFIRRTMTQLLENVYQFLLPAKYASISGKKKLSSFSPFLFGSIFTYLHFSVDHLRAVLRDLASKFDMWMVSATESLPDGARDALVRNLFCEI